MVRTIETGQYFTGPKREWRCLEEINAGICDGMTYEEIEVCPPGMS
jgi:6-phosphofructo-2-kinase/fructose-2,6-biphosphatase 2